MIFLSPEERTCNIFNHLASTAQCKSDYKSIIHKLDFYNEKPFDDKLVKKNTMIITAEKKCHLLERLWHF